MDRAMWSLYRELLKEANDYRVPVSVLSRFHKKARGKTDFSQIIPPLIREIEKVVLRNTFGRNQESALASMARKRDRFSKLQRE